MPLQLSTRSQDPITIPRLVNGDRLNQSEFHRRYSADPTISHAELVEGVVYVSSPLRIRAHGQPHGQIMAWLGLYYLTQTNLVLADNATLILDDKNEVQPDAMLFDLNSDRTQITDQDYVQGSPELIVEIAASSAAIDLHTKKSLYERFGVQEYVVWSTGDRRLDWFELVGDRYQDLEPDAAGIFRSRVFPGLWLAGRSLLEGNLTDVRAIAEQGLATRAMS